MSLKIAFLRLALAAVGGAVIGLVFRWLLVLSRKGSLDVEIKQLPLHARKESKRIAGEGAARAKEVVATSESSIAEKEEKIARQEERVFKREEALDKKQGELDSEIQAV